ncbi:MAG: hypothetical protein Q9P44_03375 [Anaerolineae bacterium]|nr:hypothetical protein [Anaerolineae bacterium]
MQLSVTRRDGYFLLLAVVLVTIYVLVAGGGFPLDDSWIHQTYGRNLALNGEWAFIPSEPSAASTSPLYTVLLAIGYFLRIPYKLWTHGLGIAALTVTAMLGARLADRLVTGKQSPEKHAGLITGLAFIMTWHLLWAAAAGMETMLFGMMSLLLIFLAWRELDSERHHDSQPLLLRGAIFGVVTALAALTRPEGIVLGGIIALTMLIVQPQGNLKNVIFWGVGSAIGFGIAISPYLWLNLQLTGGILPNTADAKFVQFAIRRENIAYIRRFYLLTQAIFAGGQFLLLVGILAYIARIVTQQHWRKVIFYLLPLWWSLALIALYAERLPAWDQHGRYVMPALPTLIVMGVVGTISLITWTRRSFLQRTLVRVLVLSTIVIYLIFVAWGIQIYRVDVAIIDSEMVTAAYWIRDNLPDDELLAIHDIGAVGYFASRPILDVAGLVSPEVIPLIDDPNAMWQYLQDNQATYFFGFPDQIPGRDPNDPRLCEIYSTDAKITQNIGQPNMTLYRLAWDATCES